MSSVEFAYNNSYHDNVEMAPYEVYGGRALSIADVPKLLTVGHSNKQSLVVEPSGWGSPYPSEECQDHWR